MSDAKKLKMISPIATILLVLLVSGTLLFISGGGSTLAAFVDGESYGLTVTVEEGFTEGGDNDVGNLNPGDTKYSYLTVSNEGTSRLRYYFDVVEIKSKAGSYRGEDGEHLKNILLMRIERAGQKLFEDDLTVGEVIALAEKDMGILGVGEEERIDISVDFPKEAGNDYQGSEVTVRFKFRAVPIEGDEGGGDYESTIIEYPPEPPEVTPPEEEIIIEPEPPAVPPVEPGEPGEEIEEELPPELPKTGEYSRPAIYAIGVLIIAAGLLLRKKSAGRVKE
jgi:LPXTG-motif cell wall-anchored protein